VAETLVYGAWMLGQGLAFAPNYSIAKMAAGRMFRIMDRKPRIYSSQTTGSSAWVSYIFSSHYTRDYSEMAFSVP
jgi:ATP-binding cassette subfamily B (MDR/TAP) protein 1